ncbi:hypothetical protein RCL1_001238 [Eukaryota sp. TZLM3-RCL]
MADKRGYHHPQRVVMGHVDQLPTALSSLSFQPQQKTETGVGAPPPTVPKREVHVPPPPLAKSAVPPQVSATTAVAPPPRAAPLVQSSPLPPTTSEVSAPSVSAPTPVPHSYTPTPPQTLAQPPSQPMAQAATLSVPSAPPSFVRHGVQCIPGSAQIASKWSLPCGFVVTPFPELRDPSISVDKVSLGDSGPLRCPSCKCYVNPYFEFHDGGRRFVCNICKRTGETDDVFLHRISSNTTLPELTNSVVDFSAPSEYTLRPPQAPAYLFVIDISPSAVSSGFVRAVCGFIKSNLSQISGDDRTLVGLLAFDTKVRYYCFNEDNEGEPLPAQELVVPDVDDMFIPCADGLFVNRSKYTSSFEKLLDQLPILAEKNVLDNSAKSSCLGTAIVAATSLMAFNGGKMIVFASQRPDLGTLELDHRERKYETSHGSSTSHVTELLRPANVLLRDLAVQCNRRQITVDMFINNQDYMDVSSLGTMSRLTGGKVTIVHSSPSSLSPCFEALGVGIKESMSRVISWESVLRVRNPEQLGDAEIVGHVFQGHKQLISIPVIGNSNHFGVILPFSSSTTEIQGPFFYSQVAVLFTSSHGERFIRVINIALPVKTGLGDLYREADVEALVALLAKDIASSIVNDRKKLSDLREELIKKVVILLATYRTTVRQIQGGATQTQLVLPEKLRLLPVYTLALLKSPLLRTESCPADKRAEFLFDFLSSSVDEIIRLLHPTLFALHEFLGNGSEFENLKSLWSSSRNSIISEPFTCRPTSLRLSTEFIKTNGIYLLAAREPIIFIAKDADSEILAKLFVTDSSTGRLLLARETFESDLIRKLAAEELDQSNLIDYIHCVRQDELGQADFYDYFVETKLSSSSVSYLEFLTLLHKRIKSKLDQ